MNPTPHTASPPPANAIFVREELYARVKGQRRWSAADTLAELLREPRDSTHVARPMSPILIDGEMPDRAWLAEIERQADAVQVPMSNGKRRRQRADSPILLSVVASYPAAPGHEDEAEYLRWRALTVAWLRERYGAERVRCVIEHRDESCLHLHALVTDEGRSVKRLHAGHGRALQMIDAGASRKQAQKEYRVGLRMMLDDYHRSVGVACGLYRTGPAPRPRRSRRDIIAIKQARAELEALEAEAAAKRREIDDALKALAALKAAASEAVSGARSRAHALRM